MAECWNLSYQLKFHFISQLSVNLHVSDRIDQLKRVITQLSLNSFHTLSEDGGGGGG